MRRRGRRPGSILAGAFVALAAIALLAPVASAASPGVGIPEATIKFLTSITFKSSATLTADVVRVELVVDVEGSQRSEVTEIPTTVKSGPTTLSYVLETPSGDLLPNTDVTALFRLTLSDGSMVRGAPTVVHYEDTRYAWKVISGEFVRVHYTDGGTSFGQRAVKVADDAIRSVSTLLGVSETDPIDFYVYADRTAFYDVLGPGTRENVGGSAFPEIRTLFANIEPSAVNDAWVGSVIPHELTHLVFDTAVRNAYHYPPRWLNEGIAVYLSESYGPTDRNAVDDAAKSGSIMPLQALTAQFPTTAERFYLAYSESVSAVSFLVHQYGRDAMVTLVKSYKAGVSDDEAFQSALKTDVAGFEAAWLTSIGAPTPSPFGPRRAPAGPVPSGWAGAAPTAGTAPGDSGSPSGGPTAGASRSPGASGQGGRGFDLGRVLVGVAVVVIGVGFGRRRSLIARLSPSQRPGSWVEVPSPSAPSPEEPDTAGVVGGFVDAPPPSAEVHASDPALGPASTEPPEPPELPAAAPPEEPPG